MDSPTDKTSLLDNDAAKGLVQLSYSSAQATSIESNNVNNENESKLTNKDNDTLEETRETRTSDSDSSKSRQDKSNAIVGLVNDSGDNTEEEASVVLDFGKTVDSNQESNVSSTNLKQEVQVDHEALQLFNQSSDVSDTHNPSSKQDDSDDDISLSSTSNNNSPKPESDSEVSLSDLSHHQVEKPKKSPSPKKVKNTTFARQSSEQFVYSTDNKIDNKSPKFQLDDLRHSQFTNSSSSDDETPNKPKPKPSAKRLPLSKNVVKAVGKKKKSASDKKRD